MSEFVLFLREIVAAVGMVLVGLLFLGLVTAPLWIGKLWGFGR